MQRVLGSRDGLPSAHVRSAKQQHLQVLGVDHHQNGLGNLVAQEEDLLRRIWLGKGTERFITSSPSHWADLKALWATVGRGICW